MNGNREGITIGKCRDSGMAVVLICLIGYSLFEIRILLRASILFLLVAMAYPLAYKPFARFWFALSTALGTVSSKVILTVLFFVLVLPVGRMRRLMGKDEMQLNRWRKGEESVFRVRNHPFDARDLDPPY